MQGYHHLKPDIMREQSYRAAGMYLGPHLNYSEMNSMDRGGTRNSGYFEYQPDPTSQYPPAVYKTLDKDDSFVSKSTLNYDSSLGSGYRTMPNVSQEPWKTQDTHNNVNSCGIHMNVDINKTLDLSSSSRNVSKHSSGEHFQPELLGQRVAGGYMYICGSCRSQYEAIASLHEHLQSHIEGGSYYYNHHTRVAFPKFDSVCKDTQTLQLQYQDTTCIGALNNVHGPAEQSVDQTSVSGPEGVENYSSSVNTQEIVYVVTYNNASETNEVNNGKVVEIKQEDEEKYEKDRKGECAIQPPCNTENIENSYETVDNDSDGNTTEYSVNNTSGAVKVKRTNMKRSKEAKTGKRGSKLMGINCKVCLQKFKQKLQLQRHVKKDHCEVKHICVMCSEQFESELDLNTHRRTAHAETVHQCELCNKVLSTKGMLEGHYLVHKGIKPFSCDLCEPKREFTRKSQLQAHMQTHSKVKHLQCEFCGKPFNARYLMINHVKHCGGIKPHKCEFCEMRFVSNHCLQRHRRKHTGEKPYVCEVCAFASGNASCLARHMRTHTGEKPFVCKYCPQAFAAPGALKKHVRTHTQEKPYVCGYCSKGFTQRWNLKTHERQHTGETPYTCKVCGVGYKQNVLLKTHMKAHYSTILQYHQVGSTPLPAATGVVLDRLVSTGYST